LPATAGDTALPSMSGALTTTRGPRKEPAPAWQLRLLGRPGLVAADGLRSIALRPKDADLLALVALAGPIQSDHVAALLWPAATGKQADTSLRQRLFRLRRETGMALVGSGATMTLEAGLRHDLAATLEQIAVDEHAGRAELLGDLDFDDLPDLAAWVGAERRKWNEQRDSALAAAASDCEQAGAIARGLVYAQRLAESSPLAEHAHRRLMRLQYLRGDRAAAIDVFERFEARLKDEQGTPPSAETIELLATIERGGTALPARRAVVPASLIRPPRLVGRERELVALDHAWSARRTFLLVGEAGIGKSRLLQEFCAGRDGIVALRARPGDADIAYAVQARLLRALLAELALPLNATRQQELALVLPELGAPIVLAGKHSGCCCIAPSTPRWSTPSPPACRQWSSTTFTSPTMPASSSCRRWRNPTRSPRCTGASRSVPQSPRRRSPECARRSRRRAGSRRSRCSRSGWHSSRC